MTRVAIYARYSSDHQRKASIEDQVRICEEQAKRENYQICHHYKDSAISGASLLLRPGIQNLIQDAMDGKFNIIITEALDRLSRDQEDIAGIYKRMCFANVKIFTLSEGWIDNLHIGLKGTMNALFLKDLADKTRRGLRGRVEQGKSGGGNSYGYKVIKTIDSNGEVILGEREIIPEEAAIIRRIFKEYIDGRSPQTIAQRLNADAIPSPQKNGWGPSTVNGNRKRGTGIINNELYIGKLVWNRLRYIKNPDTGKRVSRQNPEQDWIVKSVPHLRIIDQDIWDQLKSRQQASIRNTRPVQTGNKIGQYKRPKHLLSGLTKCGHCGSSYIIKNRTQLICASYQSKKICKNNIRIARTDLEGWVLEELRDKLMTKEAIAEFSKAYIQYINKNHMSQTKDIAASKAELKKVKKQIHNIIEAIKNGFSDFAGMKQEMTTLELRKKTLTELLDTVEEPKILLHPSMANNYQKRLSDLYTDLKSNDKSTKAIEAIRALIEKVTITPKAETFHIEITGDLAQMINFSERKNNPISSSLVRSMAYDILVGRVSNGCGGKI